jgi:hypothetical protein
MNSLCPLAVARLPWQSPIHVPHIYALFFQYFRYFCYPARQVSNIEKPSVKDPVKSLRIVTARGNAVESPKPLQSALGKRILRVNNPLSFRIQREAEQPGELALCLICDSAFSRQAYRKSRNVMTHSS